MGYIIHYFLLFMAIRRKSGGNYCGKTGVDLEALTVLWFNFRLA